MAEFDRLDPEARLNVAEQFAQVWSWFIDQFHSPRAFLEAPPAQQGAYLEGLGSVIERSKGLRRTELGRYYYSAALLWHFLEAERFNDTSDAAWAVGGRVRWLLQKGAGPQHLRAEEGP